MFCSVQSIEQSTMGYKTLLEPIKTVYAWNTFMLTENHESGHCGFKNLFSRFYRGSMQYNIFNHTFQILAPAHSKIVINAAKHEAGHTQP